MAKKAAAQIKRGIRLAGDPHVYGPGEEDVLAEKLTEPQRDRLVNVGALVGDWGQVKGKADAGEGEGSADPYADLDKDGLAALAEERKLTVTRSDGRTDLDPRVEDYLAALKAADAEEAEGEPDGEGDDAEGEEPEGDAD